MAFDADIASRIREVLSSRNDVSERKMFGGLCLMVGGHMCCGLTDKTLMLRVGPAQYEKVLAMAHTRPMDFTGRPLTGFVCVAPAGFKTKRDLARWLNLSLAYIEGLPPQKRKKRKPRKEFRILT